MRSGGEAPGGAKDIAALCLLRLSETATDPSSVEPFPVWVQDEDIRVQPTAFGLQPRDVAPGEEDVHVADVTAALLPEGRVRLYVIVSDPPTMPYIGSVISSDGLNFTAETGTRLPAGATSGQPRILPLEEGGWRLYWGTGSEIYSATSEDGLQFTLESDLRFDLSEHGNDLLSESIGGPSIVALPDGGYRMYYSNGIMGHGVLPASRVLSATSPDGLTWTADPGYRFGSLDLNDAANRTDHPSVRYNEDGDYTVYFFRQKEIWTARSNDGLTWNDFASTGLWMNDPDIFELPNGEIRMYGGLWGPRNLGGIIGSAHQEWVTWDVAITYPWEEPIHSTFLVMVTGASETPVELRLTADGLPGKGEELRDVIIDPAGGRPPLYAVFNIPFDQYREVDKFFLTATDGTVSRYFVVRRPGT